MLTTRLLENLINIGCLKIFDAAGRNYQFQGQFEGPQVTVRLHDQALHRKLFFNPLLHLGEGVMDGTISVEDGELYDLMDLLAQNIGWRQPKHWLQTFFVAPMRGAVRRLRQYNPISKARSNVAHHYDLTGELYDLFLDDDRQYSCAYFRTPEDDLETAQFQKKQHLAAKLCLQPGQKILDIGSGWGGLGLYLAKNEDVMVKGITLSEEQYKISNQRAAEEKLNNYVTFDLQDYRAVEGPFDRIISVGMFEHVGINHYRKYFEKIRNLLTDDGVAVIHTIGRADGPGSTNPWINKYIFPGGYSPALSEISPVVEKSDLYITDVEVFRLQYAETLRHWRERFYVNRRKVRELFDERFCRMWDFYLCGSEVAFRYGGHVVFQIQLTKQPDAVPQTRDYIFDEERKRIGPEDKSDSRAA